MSTPTATDTLARVQDALCERLQAGAIAAADMPAAFAQHVADLTAAGFNENEARACFWDAVATARHVAEVPASRAIEPGAIYTVREAARLAAMSPATMQRKLSRGVINASRRLGTWRVRGADLLKIA